MATHTIVPDLLQHQVRVALVGAGGSGSQVLSGLARLDRSLRALGHPGGLAVTVYDPDQVSDANVGRQLFSPSDVGLAKAVVLVHRVNCFFGLDWQAVSAAYDSRTAPGGGDRFTRLDLLITCVDTAAARREIAATWRKERALAPHYWLDLGNRQQDGQVVLGQPERAGSVASSRDFVAGRERMKQQAKPLPRLPHVLDLFPELLDERQPEDDRPSCSLAEALEVQDLFVNQAVSTWALHLLWRLFREGQVTHHGYFVNLANGWVTPLAVPEPPKERKLRRKRAQEPERVGT